MQKFEYRSSLSEFTVSLGAIVRSEAKNGEKNFWNVQIVQNFGSIIIL